MKTRRYMRPTTKGDIMSEWFEDNVEKELLKSKEVVSRLKAEKEKYSGKPEHMDQWMLLFDAESSLNHLAIHIQYLQDKVVIAERRAALFRRK